MAFCHCLSLIRSRLLMNDGLQEVNLSRTQIPLDHTYISTV